MDTSVLVFLWGPPVPWCPHGLPCPLGFPKQPVQIGWCRAASGHDTAAAVPILIFLLLTPRLAITQAAPLGATFGDRRVLTAACVALPAGSSAVAAAQGSSTVPSRKPAEGRAGPCGSENASGDMDSHDYATESGVSRSPGETCTSACLSTLVNASVCLGGEGWGCTKLAAVPAWSLLNGQHSLVLRDFTLQSTSTCWFMLLCGVWCWGALGCWWDCGESWRGISDPLSACGEERQDPAVLFPAKVHPMTYGRM